MKRQFTVTQADIERAKPGSGMTCPIARCIGRHFADFKGAPIINVTPARVEINDRDYPLPEVARAFVSRYDAGEKVRPFSFTLVMGDK